VGGGGGGGGGGAAAKVNLYLSCDHFCATKYLVKHLSCRLWEKNVIYSFENILLQFVGSKQELFVINGARVK
jgi:hypothetical protein